MNPPAKTCVFHATKSNGPWKGDGYVCGAPAVGDYADQLYKDRRPVCRMHRNVVLRSGNKTYVPFSDTKP